MTEQRATNVLEIDSLEVSYLTRRGEVKAVDGVSLSIAEGQVFGLAGESGSGKSTLAMAILRVLRPPAVITGGEVRVGGRDMLELTDRELRRVRWRSAAIVFQSALNVLNPVIRIEEQIVDVIRAHEPASRAEAAARAAECMQMAGLSPAHLRNFPHQLSGGMRQRVVIAIALALEPQLLILDEPTTALDVVVQREILEQLRELQRSRRFATLFITHDLSLLSEFADRLAIMYAGQVVETGTSDEIFNDPLHPYTRGLRDSFPTAADDTAHREGIPGSPPDMLAPPPGCRFHQRCPSAMPRCTTVVPLRRRIRQSGRDVACHLYAEDVE